MIPGQDAIFRITARDPEAHGRPVRVRRWRCGTCGAAIVEDVETGRRWFVDPCDLELVQPMKRGGSAAREV